MAKRATEKESIPAAMPRRSFLGATALALAGLSLPAAAARAAGDPRAAAGWLSNAPPTEGPQFEEATFSDLAEAMASGRLTSRSVVEGYIDNINAIDRSGPLLNAVL